MKSTTKLGLVIVISIIFFCVEIAVGFRTKSIALIADAFHYLNDIIAYLIAFTAAHLHNSTYKPPQTFTYALHRAELLGAFFNGVFLLALALSIFLQSIERFVSLEEVKDPLWMLIVGGAGLTLNLVSAGLVHDHHGHGHGHVHGHDSDNAVDVEETIGAVSLHPISTRRSSLSTGVEEHSIGDSHASHNHAQKPPVHKNMHGNFGMLGVLIHVLGDAANNIGVMIAATIIWQTHSPARFYADPAVSLLISIVIFGGAIPLTIKTGRILLEASPLHLDLDHIKEDLLASNNVSSIHDLHIWQLSQSVILASLHAKVPPTTSLAQWEKIEGRLRECMRAYGVSHLTVGLEVEGEQLNPLPAPNEGGGGECKAMKGGGCAGGDMLGCGGAVAGLRQRVTVAN